MSGHVGATHGAWRNLAGVPGPHLATLTCRIPLLRKYLYLDPARGSRDFPTFTSSQHTNVRTVPPPIIHHSLPPSTPFHHPVFSASLLHFINFNPIFTLHTTDHVFHQPERTKPNPPNRTNRTEPISDTTHTTEWGAEHTNGLGRRAASESLAVVPIRRGNTQNIVHLSGYLCSFVQFFLAPSVNILSASKATLLVGAPLAELHPELDT